MTGFAWDYLLFVFIACCGALQIAAAHSKLRGISFFQKALTGYLFGALAIIMAYVWFFISEERSLPFLEGPDKVGLAFLGWILAFLFTILVSSVVKARLRHSGEKVEQTNPGAGFDTLKRMTYFQAIGHLLKGRRQG